MDSHSRKVLEFDRICQFLSTFAMSPGGKQQCEILMPLQELKAVSGLLQETAQMRQEIEQNGRLPLNGISDIRQAIARSRIKQFYLEPLALLRIQQTLETAAAIKHYFAGMPEARPLLWGITEQIMPLPRFTSRVHQSISAQGEILDNASPQLADIRSQIKKLRLTIVRTLEQMVGDVDISYAFQDDFITIRNNRYVIPVRSDSKNIVPGVVHDQSQTKATFFVEPISIVSQNNELQILRKEEYYEEIRILTDLTRMVDEHADEILADLDVLERIDVIHARALFSQALDATAPEVNTESRIRLRRSRHPILLAEFKEDRQTDLPPEGEGPGTPDAAAQGHWEFDRPDVVAVDLIKETGSSVLIITGANAGGKTVAMKTLGLFVLMTQAGMHIPVAPGSHIALYDQVFADIGDEQNIEASLSTFSAHMAQIKTIVTQVTDRSLVLLDELGSGTDPAEGGALAAAVLDFLREKGCTTVITTHLSILKTYAYNHANVVNLSVAFDPVTLRPTFNLLYGVPGISNALAIAKNIGIHAAILQEAGKYITNSDKQVVELIRGLEKTERLFRETGASLQRITLACQQYQAILEGLVDAIKSRKDKILKNFEMSARTILRESEEKLIKIIKEQKRRRIIRPDEDVRRQEGLRDAVADVRRELVKHYPRRDMTHQAVEHLDSGQVVNVPHLLRTGVVIAADNKARRAEVLVGTMRVKLGYAEIEPATVQPQTRPHAQSYAAQKKDVNSCSTPALAQINVIGLRAADALPLVDKAIDNALMRGAETVEVVHGRGTGRLMRAIHEHLKVHQCVSSFASGDQNTGGTGITIVYLKN